MSYRSNSTIPQTTIDGIAEKLQVEGHYKLYPEEIKLIKTKWDTLKKYLHPGQQVYISKSLNVKTTAVKKAYMVGKETLYYKTRSAYEKQFEKLKQRVVYKYENVISIIPKVVTEKGTYSLIYSNNKYSLIEYNKFLELQRGKQTKIEFESIPNIFNKIKLKYNISYIDESI